MADLSSTTAAAVGAVTGAGVATALPGVDIGAIVGGFGGALFFVVFARDPSFWASLGYLLSSWVFGYFAAGELVAQGAKLTTGFSALIAAALFVILATGVLDWVKGGKRPFWFRYLPWIGGKSDG